MEILNFLNKSKNVLRDVGTIVITSSNTGTQKKKWWHGMRVESCMVWTWARNSHSALLFHSLEGQLYSQSKLRMVFGFWGKSERCTWHLQSTNSVSASAGQIQRSISMWEIWMHFCRGYNCGPGKCPVSTIRKQKKVVKEGWVWLDLHPCFSNRSL